MHYGNEKSDLPVTRLNEVLGYRRSNLGQVKYRLTKGIVYGINSILDIMVHPMRSSWSMWEPTWVSRSRCWLLPESRLGHVCMSPEPVGSTHLRFGDARVVKICICSNQNVVRSPG